MHVGLLMRGTIGLGVALVLVSFALAAIIYNDAPSLDLFKYALSVVAFIIFSYCFVTYLCSYVLAKRQGLRSHVVASQTLLCFGLMLIYVVTFLSEFVRYHGLDINVADARLVAAIRLVIVLAGLSLVRVLTEFRVGEGGSS